jgi:hypothetical protein
MTRDWIRPLTDFFDVSAEGLVPASKGRLGRIDVAPGLENLVAGIGIVPSRRAMHALGSLLQLWSYGQGLSALPFDTRQVQTFSQL